MHTRLTTHCQVPRAKHDICGYSTFLKQGHEDGWGIWQQQNQDYEDSLLLASDACRENQVFSCFVQQGVASAATAQ